MIKLTNWQMLVAGALVIAATIAANKFSPDSLGPVTTIGSIVAALMAERVKADEAAEAAKDGGAK